MQSASALASRGTGICFSVASRSALIAGAVLNTMPSAGERVDIPWQLQDSKTQCGGRGGLNSSARADRFRICSHQSAGKVDRPPLWVLSALPRAQTTRAGSVTCRQALIGVPNPTACLHLTSIRDRLQKGSAFL